MYKTIVIEYSLKADDMAKKIEEKANEMLQDGYELITSPLPELPKLFLCLKNKDKLEGL